jgi:sugar lactone lactonase YvrE
MFCNIVLVDAYRESGFECAGVPDGMTVDAEGKLWVAVYGGGALLQIDPETQTELLKIEMPVLCPTSMAFGGRSVEVEVPCLCFMRGVWW